MKKLIITSLLISSLCVWADKAPAPNESKRHYISAADMERNIYLRTGGKLVRPGTMSGTIVYVNCQDSAPNEWLEESASFFRNQVKLQTQVTSGTFNFPNVKTKGNLSLFVIDDALLPPLLHAPESGWAMVNVAKLKDEERPQFFKARVKKELSRAFALLAGAQNSAYQGSLMGPIKATEELDKFVNHKLPVDVMPRFVSYVSAFGITPAVQVTYLQAVKEGWAPAPTNDVQKAIWDKVHAMPTEPIKIKPEEKKTER